MPLVTELQRSGEKDNRGEKEMARRRDNLKLSFKPINQSIEARIRSELESHITFLFLCLEVVPRRCFSEPRARRRITSGWLDEYRVLSPFNSFSLSLTRKMAVGFSSSSDNIVIKAPTDRRLYRVLHLPNGLCAVLIHDPEIYPEGSPEPSNALENGDEEEVEDEYEYEEEDEDEDEEEDEDEDLEQNAKKK